ncbi:MAG: imidazolonepropionase [Maribacter sp.]
MEKINIIGPFKQLVPMTDIPLKGPVKDDALLVIYNGGIVTTGDHILAIGNFEHLKEQYPHAEMVYLKGNHVCVPGFIDAHTHICFGGSRASDYAMRNAGKTYLEIATSGGGIWDTVTETRKATQEALTKSTVKLANRHLKNGTTTIEVKSGYGLTVDEELKMLRAIRDADVEAMPDVIATCLAAHMLPKDFKGTETAYLDLMGSQLFPILLEEGLTTRIDAFIEKSAFSAHHITPYFKKAKELGFDITVHADQFSTGGSKVAVDFNAVSADHLEACTLNEIAFLAKSDTIATALPGASIGLGCAFAPARKLLDAGGALAIASDHNPGSAPMGDLLTQASILGAFEKLTNAEILSGITFRAAAALHLKDRGKLEKGLLADLAVFHSDHYQDILYHQGNLKPCMIWKKGKLVFDKHG